MFTKFKRDVSTIFLDPAVEQTFAYDKTKKVSVILSPSIYWVKKLKLPVKNAREAKKLLPSIFEDSLPAGHYSYYAYKQGEEFFLFAYEDKKIFDLLSKSGVSPSDIASIHFAQSEFSEANAAFCINEKQCMYLKDELLVLAPSAWISEKEKLSLENIKLSNHSIKLQQYGHIVDKSSLYKIGAILTIMALILIVEIFIASAKKDDIVLAKESVFSKYNLQSTMFQNRSSLDKYSKTHLEQSKLRENISYFLSMKLPKNQTITLIDYKNKILSVTITGVKKESSIFITKQLDTHKVKYNSSFKNDNMKVEVKI